MFTRLLEAGGRDTASLDPMLRDLFGAMAKGGRLGIEPVDWFNGGLFDSPETLPLERDDLKVLRGLAALDWSAIEPSIFGTLFERGLDPGKRSQLGAHYTDAGSIMRLVNPVVLEPLRDEWSERKREIEDLMGKAAGAKSPSARTRAAKEAHGILQGFLDRLVCFRVLDPACGSGNFLLLSLLGLKDLEHRVILETEALGLPRAFPMVGPENVLGIELNPYAAELARVTVWIGEIQWMLAHGFAVAKTPILKPLDTIEQRDAVMNQDGSEPEWPEADVIVGNPPFLGDKKMLGALGAGYVTKLRRLYQGRVPGGADLVTYWFEKARAQLDAGRARFAGLVATNSIRGGANRKVLERITEAGAIFSAWSDEPWINEGAAVRVSLLAFAATGFGKGPTLDGQEVARIQSDLTPATDASASGDLTAARPLPENAGTAYVGIQKTGPFEIPGEVARQWLTAPNPHGRSNGEVVRPWFNGLDISRRSRDMWIIDFGVDMAQEDASLFEAPFAYAQIHVQPTRVGKREKRTNEHWWIFQWARPVMRKAIAGLPRFIVTPEVAKHRVFAMLDRSIVPDKNLSVIARADDTTFGILQSRFHELWSLRMCTWLGKGNDPRYTPTTTFETFPFPEGLTPADTAGPTDMLDSGVVLPPVAPERRAAALAIAEAAHRLNALRENWLNPPEWVERVPDVVPGYPDRIVPKPEHAAEIKKRTLTNLYNARPAWLDNAHKALDAAVAAAYGWDDYDPDIARR